MTTINITGSAVVLKSGLTLAELQKLSKYDPAAMEIRDEHEKLVFKVAIASSGAGDWSDKAVYFAPVTHDENGRATITVGIPEAVKDAKEWVVDELMRLIGHVDALEAQMSEALSKVDAAKAELLGQITVL